MTAKHAKIAKEPRRRDCFVSSAFFAAFAVFGSADQERPSSAPTFEVATVKINNSGAARPGHTVVPQSGQVTVTNITVAALIQEAYDVQLASLIVDMPEWARTQRVDVVAKALRLRRCLSSNGCCSRCWRSTSSWQSAATRVRWTRSHWSPRRADGQGRS